MLFACQFLGWQVGEFTHPVFASLDIPLSAFRKEGVCGFTLFPQQRGAAGEAMPG